MGAASDAARGHPMNRTKPEDRDPKAATSARPLQDPPTPEDTAAEKKEQEEQAAEIAKPKPSGAV